MKRVGQVINAACIAWFVWLFLSWVDVILHNTMPNPVYQPWNLFTLFF